MLCTEVPSIEAGTAAIEPLPDGGEGMAVSYTLDPRATWGDGTPITTRDVVFTWEVGRHPQSGVAAHSYYVRVLPSTSTTITATPSTTTGWTTTTRPSAHSACCPSTSSGTCSSRTPRPIASGPATKPTPPIPASISVPSGSPRSRAARTCDSSATRTGGGGSRTSRRSSFGPSRTRCPRSEPALGHRRLHRGRARADD